MVFGGGVFPAFRNTEKLRAFEKRYGSPSLKGEKTLFIYNDGLTPSKNTERAVSGKKTNCELM